MIKTKLILKMLLALLNACRSIPSAISSSSALVFVAFSKSTVVLVSALVFVASLESTVDSVSVVTIGSVVVW